MDASPVLDLIRAETAALHERLEARLDILSRLADPTLRRRVMARFWGLYAGVEDALAHWLGGVDGLDYEARRKTRVLAGDLAALGVNPDDATRMAAPALSSPAEALGFQYVLEGSTLGGKVIRRDAEARGLTLEGLSFFDVYGAQTGARWRDFRAVLERACAADPAAAARGARRGFTLIEDWLCGEGARREGAAA